MKKVLMILADGFEELEFVAPFDILLRGGVEVVTVSISKEREVTSVRNLVVRADQLLDQVDSNSFDLIFLPGGGPGTKNLRKHSAVVELVRKHHQNNKEVAAICAAPLILGDVGLLRGMKATCFPSCQAELAELGALVTQDRVCQDGLIWTSRGAGSAAEFGFALLAHLVNQAKADEVRAQMQFA